MTGYEDYSENQAHQFLLMQKLHDPTLFPNDTYVDTLDLYVSPVHELLSRMLSWFSIEVLALLLYLASRILVIFSAAWLAMTWANGSRFAAIMTAIFIAFDPLAILGDGTILKAYGEHTSLFVGCFLLGSTLLIRRHYALAALLVSALFYINILYGCYAVSYWGLVLLFHIRSGVDRKKLLLFLAAVAIATAPMFYRALQARDGAECDAEFWRAVCRIRIPHHLFPLEWDWSVYVKFILFTLFVPLYIYRFKPHAYTAMNQRNFIVWSLVGAGWLGAAFIAAYTLPQLRLLMLQPARATDLWYTLGAIGVIVVASGRWERVQNLTALLELGMVFLSLLLVFSSGDTRVLIIAVIVCGAVVYFIGKSRFSSLKSNPWLPVQFAILVLVAVSAKAAIERKKDSESGSHLTVGHSQSVLDLTAWIKNNTPKDATFLTPPDMSPFRALTQRSSFVNWRDGSAVLWDCAYAAEWVERVKALNFDPFTVTETGSHGRKMFDRSYDLLTEAHMLQLQEKYPIDYWIVRDAATTLPVVHTVDRYSVVELP